jgi:hypothetical protein
VVGSSNFFAGSWLVIVLVPILMAILMAIHRHYRDLNAALAVERIPLADEVAARPIVVVPIARLDRPALQAIAFANSLSADAVAVHVTNDASEAEQLREQWPSWAASTNLVIVESPYRALAGPLLAYLDVLDLAWPPDRPDPITFVVIPEYVARSWWERLMYNQSAKRLRSMLLGRPHTVIVNVPYRREDPEPG